MTISQLLLIGRLSLCVVHLSKFMGGDEGEARDCTLDVPNTDT
jgi:hypothetical protein